jgi:serine/threonine protein kinase
MREEGGRIVLMDFGAGRDDARASSMSRGATWRARRSIMAPELFSGARADQRSDIYALGALSITSCPDASP